MIGRLRPAVSPASACAVAGATLRSGDRRAGVDPKWIAERNPRVRLLSALPRHARANDPSAKVSLLLGGVSLLVLLLACRNVANLLLALVLAAVGLYGVLAYDVSQRMHEMGVRIALGARGRDVSRLVVGEGLRLVTLGGAVGFAIALAAGRFVEPLLFQTSPREPTIFGVVALVVVAVSTAATLLPAWRAGRVDPVVALRAE